ncbi:DDE_3 domain-containing protein [Trichonephila clavipes]|uniref:DDE_3 domain-containing protein n=1 Tax=Trichonephila clavipes TaxID=2585209 RepID=A0A8X6S0I4_TRICX|nr:DDE_3 domain-containing protein [Trichonephila clavipes]
MDDNARPHRANIVDECFQSEYITRMDWPAYSPDSNPIEHVWNMLGRRIAARQTLPPVYRNFGGHYLIDEAHFWLNDYVNKQNCRIWSEANPQVYVETPLHPEKLTVWCALWAGGILLQKR